MHYNCNRVLVFERFIMNKKLTVVLFIGGVIGVANADCLNKLLPDFNANTISVEGKNGKYKLNDANCSVSPKELEAFVNKNFIKLSPDKNVVQSWNYLAINKKPVYDYLKQLKQNDGDFTSDDSYQLFGVVNNQFACYKFNYDEYSNGAAYPNMGYIYSCDYPGGSYSGDKSVDINQVIDQKDIVSAIIKNKDVSAILKENGVKPSSITTSAQLYKALMKDGDMECVIGEKLPTTFAITNVNSNGTIDAIYSLGVNALHVCQGVAPSGDIIMKNVKPKIMINSFITPQDLKPISLTK